MTLQSASLSTLNEVAIHLYGSKTQYLVESHGGLLHVEWLSQIVIGTQCDVLRAHILWRQHGISHQDELHVLSHVVGLQLITQITTRHAEHLLFADYQVALHLLQIDGSLLNIVVNVEVVNVLESCSSKLQELLVVVDHNHSEPCCWRVHSRT